MKRVGCVGMCHQTPLLEISTPWDAGRKRLFAKVNADDAAEIVLAHFKPRGRAAPHRPNRRPLARSAADR